MTEAIDWLKKPEPEVKQADSHDSKEVMQQHSVPVRSDIIKSLDHYRLRMRMVKMSRRQLLRQCVEQGYPSVKTQLENYLKSEEKDG